MVENPPLNRKKHVIALIIFLSLLIALGGYFYYQYSAQNISKEKYQDLGSIAKLKKEQIEQWRKERRSEFEFFSTNPMLIRYTHLRENNKEAPEVKATLKQRLRHIKENHGYKDIILISPDKEILLSLQQRENESDSSVIQYLDKVFRRRQIETTGLYKNKELNTPVIDFIAPVISESNKLMGALLFRVDPNIYLYPLIQSWPDESETSETFIVRQEGDSVLFLNDLRHRNNTALNLKISLRQMDLPAAQAVMGYSGIWEGKDYRGKDVLAHIQPVNNTPWFLITKVDKSEIYAPLRREIVYIAVFVLLGILFITAAISFIYSYRQRNLYKKLAYSQEEYRTTLQSIGDAVITTDEAGKVQYLNPIAESLTGWKERQAQNKQLEEVFNIINEGTGQKVESPVNKVLAKGTIVGLANHTILVSRKGRKTPIADSGAPIKDQEGIIKGVVLVFRDQTEEREHQKNLEESKERYKSLFENNPFPMWIYDLESLQFLMVNNAAVDSYGYSREEFLEMTIKDIRPIEDVEKLQEDIRNTSSRYNEAGVWRHVKKNGEIIYVEISSHLIDFEHRKARLILAKDVTDRVTSERLQRIQYNIAHAVATTSTLHELYNTIKKELSSVINTENFIIAMYDQESEMLTIPFYEDEKDELPKEWSAEETITGYCLRRKEPLLIRRNGIEQLVNKGEIKIIGTIPEVWLGVPLKTDKKIIGAIVLQNYEDPMAYDKNSLQLMEAVANQLSIYIQNKQVETELFLSEKKYRNIFNESPVGILHYDKNGTISDCNEKFVEIIGSSKAELIGLNMIEQLKDEKIIAGVKKSLIEGYAYYEGIYESITATKRTHVKIHFQGITNKQNEITSGIGLVEDISAQKEAEDRLRYYSEMQKLLTDISSKYINVHIEEKDNAIEKGLEEVGEFVSADRAYVFDYDFENNVTNNTHEWCNKGITSQINMLTEIPLYEVPYWEEKHRKGETIYIPNVKELPDDRLKELLESQNIKSLITVPMMYKNNVMGFVGFDSVRENRIYSETEQALLEVFAQILVNIQMRFKTEKELLDAKREAEESNRLKSAFLANMNHEIRTPMNGIMGFTDLLKDPDMTGEEQKQYIGMIEKSGNRMLNTINDLIDISRIEAGQAQLNLKEVNINDQLDDMYQFFKYETEKKGLKLDLDKEKENLVIETDEEKFTGIMTNLIKNAIKFTSEGDIRFGYKERKSDYLFYVEDTGIGIPTEKQKNIFERFIQADNSHQRSYQGSGLGLSITKAYVEMLNGHMWMSSAENKGSTFYFTLPKTNVAQSPSNKKQKPADKKEITSSGNKYLKILIVEDDEASDLYLETLIKNISREILHAYTGPEALEVYNANTDIDLILMDIQLPGMDGYKVTRKLREKNSEVVIIAQTAYAMKGDHEKAVNAGCDDYVPKPIKKEKLLRMIDKYFSEE